MKKIILLCTISILGLNAAVYSQMKIGATTAPVSASLLELESANQGFVLPRVSLTSVSSNAPLGSTILTSTMVYNTNTSIAGGSGTGVYYWDGSKWNFLATNSSLNSAWLITGNSGTTSASNFLGTTDNNGLAFGTNNVHRMLIDTLGDVAIGSTAYDPYNREKLLVDYGNTTSNTLVNLRGSTPSYLQLNVQNTSSDPNASTDIVATADNGTDTTNFVDFGINSSNYLPSVDNWGSKNDAYLYSYSRNLLIGTQALNSDLVFLVSGGLIKNNTAMRIVGTSGNIVVGKGEATTTPTGNIIRAPNAVTSSPNISGGDLTLQGGSSTGTVTGGNIFVKGGTSVSGTTGAVNINTNVNGPTNINTGTSTGNVSIGNTGNGILFPGINTPGGVIYTNNTAGKIGSTSAGTNGQVLTSTGGGTPVWANPATATTTNTLTSSGNTLTSTVNGIAATAPAVNTVSNSSNVNTLITTVNGVAGTGVNIINTNTTTLTGSSLVTSVNGVTSTPLDLSPVITSKAWALTGNTGTTPSSAVIGAAVNNNFIGTTDAKDFVIATNNLERLRITSAGLVGLGVAGPQQTLSVSNGENIDQSGSNTGTVANTLTFGSGSAEGIGSKRNAGVDQYGLDFYTAGNNRMTISNGGFVGIGTNNPTNPLTIFGNNPLYLSGVQATSSLTSDSILTISSGVVKKAPYSSFTPTNLLTSSVNTLTSTVNGIAATAPAVNTVSNSSNVNTLTTTVNGVAGTGVNIINTNTTTLTGSSLVTSVNGVTSTPLDLSPVITSKAWALTGNTGTTPSSAVIGAAVNNNFIGTTDAKDFVIATNNLERLRITSAGLVGLGVAGPQQTLSVSNGENIDQSGSNTGTVANTLTFGSGSAEGIGSKRNAGVDQYGLDFYTAGNNRMTISNGGFVGIGTNNATNPLTIFGNNPLYLSGVQATANFTTDSILTISNGVVKKAANSSLGSSLWSLTGNSGTNPGNNFIGTTDGVDFITKTNSIERMRVTSGGFVGIGVTNPQQALSIGNGEDIDQNNLNIGSTVNSLIFGSVSGEAIGSKRNAGGNQNGMDFYTAYINRMSITNGGFVGIGVTNPSNVLSVFGNNPLYLSGVQATANFTTDSILTISNGVVKKAANSSLGSSLWSLTGNSGTNPGNNFIGTTDGVDFITKTNSIERMRVTSGGFVGIGVTNPQQALSVGNSIVVDQNDLNNGTITNSLIFGNNNSGEAIGSKRTVNGDQYGMDFYSNYAIRMSITNGGFIGIGTTNPSNPLTIFGNNPLYLSGVQATSSLTSDSILTISSGVVKKAPYSSFAPTNTLTSSGNTLTSTVNGIAATAPAVNTVSNSSNVNTLITTVNGVAGTGVNIINTNTTTLTGSSLVTSVNGVTSTPLDLSPVITSKAWALTGNTGTTPSSAVIGAAVNNNFIGTTDAKDFVIATNNLERLRITSAGLVGLGVAGPQQTLSVSNGENIDQSGSNTGTVANTLTFGSGSAEGIGSKRNAGVDQYGLDFYTAGNNRMTISNGGFVGIGTNNPTNPLTIFGNNPLYLSGVQATSSLTSDSILTISSGVVKKAPYSSFTPTNTLTSSGNTLTSTVNGIAATAPAVNTVSNSSNVNTLTTTVNGVTGLTVPIINTNTNTLTQGNGLVTTVNGVVATTAIASGTVANILGYNTSGLPVYQPASALSGSSSWSLTGNTGTIAGTNFLGTVDAKDLVFKVNNVQAGYLGTSSNYMTSFGTGASAVSFASAFGPLATAAGQYSVASGYNSSAANQYSTALGYNSQATGNLAVALGASAAVSGQSSIAIGNAAQSSQSTSIALGYSSVASAQDAIAIGDAAQAKTNSDNIALGHTSVSAGFQSLALGVGSSSSNNQTIAIGVSANASSYQAIAIGNNAVANTNNSTVALGNSTNASGYQAIAVGDASVANASNSIALGYGAKAQGSNSVALGYNAQTSQNNALILGDATNTSLTVGIGTSTPNTAAKLDVAGTFKLGSVGTVIGSLIKGNVAVTVGAIGIGGSGVVTFTVANAAVGATVSVSPRSTLPTSVVIGYAYVSSANTITIVFGVGGTPTSGFNTTLDVTIIQ